MLNDNEFDKLLNEKYDYITKEYRNADDIKSKLDEIQKNIVDVANKLKNNLDSELNSVKQGESDIIDLIGVVGLHSRNISKLYEKFRKLESLLAGIELGM